VRENCQHGSEGGEATSLPYPYRLGRAKDVDARDKSPGMTNGGERFADTWPFTGKKTELPEGGLSCGRRSCGLDIRRSRKVLKLPSPSSP